MASKTTHNKAPKKLTATAAADEVEELQSEVQEVEVEEAQVETPEVGEATPREQEIVAFALIQDISPAPKVGVIDLVRDYGMTDLKKGVVKIPRVVAEVLADRGYGTIV